MNPDSQIKAERFGTCTELTISCPKGEVVVTLELPDSELVRLFLAATEASEGGKK